jgi:hypothetical protein
MPISEALWLAIALGGAVGAALGSVFGDVPDRMALASLGK